MHNYTIRMYTCVCYICKTILYQHKHSMKSGQATINIMICHVTYN